VMIAGIILLPKSFVLALNCLQNSMMFTPFAPSAGPIGGAGLADPALITNFTIAPISFAILFAPALKGVGTLFYYYSFSLCLSPFRVGASCLLLFNLHVTQLERSFTSEDLYSYFQFFLFFINFFNGSG